MHAELFQSCPTLAILWTVAHQAPLSMGFSRREFWGGLPCPLVKTTKNKNEKEPTTLYFKMS